MRSSAVRVAAATIVGMTLLAACSSTSGSSGVGQEPTVNGSSSTSAAADAGEAETAGSGVGSMDEAGVVTVGLAETYTPQSTGTATDDYRCFLLSTGLSEDRFITGVRFLPDNPAVVHHAILYRVAASQVDAAQRRDAQDEGQGWSCFGGPDLPAASDSGDGLSSLNSAPWLAAWAPGGRESKYPEGTGVFVGKGSSVILQVHYNLLAGQGPDATSVKLRTVPGDSGLTPLETMLLPAPVELPCLPDEDGPLCDREVAVEDTIKRFGGESLRTIWGLQLLCGGDLVEPKAASTQSCTHRVKQPLTVYAAAGHMHLLGRSIDIVANKGTDREVQLLDVPVWDFDSQGAIPLASPVDLKPGDSLTVTCTHDAKLRRQLPALAGSDARYITWGEGTTDEMCLGILTAARG
jgi:hypothetical protein